MLVKRSENRGLWSNIVGTPHLYKGGGWVFWNFTEGGGGAGEGGEGRRWSEYTHKKGTVGKIGCS